MRVSFTYVYKRESTGAKNSFRLSRYSERKTPVPLPLCPPARPDVVFLFLTLLVRAVAVLVWQAAVKARPMAV